MSTRCNIHFNDGSAIVANVYRHSDGYPGKANGSEYGVLSDLQKFFAAVAEQTKGGMSGNRFDDPCYLSVRFIVWQAAQFARDAAKPLDLLSLGIMSEDACDGEYIYTVNCSKHDAKGFPIVTYRAAR